MMKSERRTLPVEIRQAVDLLLDHGASAQSGVMKITTPLSPAGLKAVERTLELLDQCPAADPPADLVARTLELIDSNPIPPPDLSDSQIIDSNNFNNPPTSS
jgi:hypothetical protein